MHFLYVDESGDVGSKPSSSRHFILCGILVHHADWRKAYAATTEMRCRLHAQFGLHPLTELHASEFLGRDDRHLSLARNVRYRCALHVLGFISRNAFLMPLRTTFAKATSDMSPREEAWRCLLQQACELLTATPPENCPAHGMIVICDDHRSAPRRGLLEKMPPEVRASIIEQPFGMDSRDTQFLQLADLLAYLTKQANAPAKTFSDAHSRRILRRSEQVFLRRPA